MTTAPPTTLSSIASINKIAFIGAGKMAGAIVGGLLNHNIGREKIHASTASTQSADRVATQFGIVCTTNNVDTCKDADVLILCVKPQMMRATCEEIAPHVNENMLIISVAAGIPLASLERWLGPFAMVRCMPNTPASIGMGAHGLFLNHRCTKDDAILAKAIFMAVGSVIIVKEEHLINSVTALSGSGPAYVFLFIEAMIEAAQTLGLQSDQATELAIQTVLGAANLAQQSEESIAQLTKNVMSPKGTTEQAVLAFEKNGLKEIVLDAMQACHRRAEEIETEMGAQ